MDTGVRSQPRPHLLRRTTENRTLDEVARGSLQRQGGARDTRRLVVSVMQIRPTSFGVGDRARFVLRKRQRRAGQGRLAEQRQNDRYEAQ